MWEHQVGLYQGANMGLLKTVFEVNLGLFGKPAADGYVSTPIASCSLINPNTRTHQRTLLLFVIRDHLGTTSVENLISTLTSDIERIWDTISKPTELKDRQLRDYFDLLFTTLSHKLLTTTLYRFPAHLCEALGDTSVSGCQHYYGGARPKKGTWNISEVQPYVIGELDNYWLQQKFVRYHSHCHVGHARLHPNMLHVAMPLHILAQKLACADIRDLSQFHNLTISKNSKLTLLKEHLINAECQEHVTIFVPVKGLELEQVPALIPSIPSHEGRVEFPPQPLSSYAKDQIIEDFCKELSPEKIIENGCAVCGSLTLQKSLSPVTEFDLDFFQPLCKPGQGITKCERSTPSDLHQEIPGPVMLSEYSGICSSCLIALRRGKCPRLSLANGGWLGKVPACLQDLSFAEKLMISRMYHNKFIVRVGCGQVKLKGNVILFTKPMQKVYAALPPPRNELQEVLAIVFFGPTQPTIEDYKRIPLLVRHKKVIDALSWLKLNHRGYQDLSISMENLSQYREDEPPVVVEWRWSANGTMQPEGLSKHSQDTREEEGVMEGKCPFIVHGLTSDRLAGKTTEQLKSLAFNHMENNGFALGIGHASEPVATFDNPDLYPLAFPWLFPYGLGGIKNDNQVRVSEGARIKHLLMYHDKRFQLDPTFVLMAFNHQQIKSSSLGGHLLAKHQSFPQVVEHLEQIDTDVMKNLTERIKNDGFAHPENDAEAQCYRLLNDLDFVGSKVSGSVTQKKYMRNEIWSMISYLGAPSWFITFSPVDVKHPLSIYYASTGETFKPDLSLLSSDKAYSLICENPVAGARFFNFIVKAFIKHILGIDADHDGVFGKTSGYYGTVEQQGRLTLHLHMLLWLVAALTPQEIRERLLGGDSKFQQELIQYLEGVMSGGFDGETMLTMKDKIDHSPNKDPTKMIPTPPSLACTCLGSCENRDCYERWKAQFNATTNEILYRSNRHSCRLGGCKAHPNALCKARFPRPCYEETIVDNQGHVEIKHQEAWLNTFCCLLSYLMRCNSDVTSLLSGTSIKAVIAYVTDYITKTPLKSHVMFDIIQGVLQRNAEVIGENKSGSERARKLMVQITNAFMSHLELGAPFAATYLLGLPDHYTNFQFKVCYWQSYVDQIEKIWKESEEREIDSSILDMATVLIYKTGKSYKATSPLYDYVYRPQELTAVCLYDFLSLYEKIKLSRQVATNETSDTSDSEGESGNDANDFIAKCGSTYKFCSSHPQYNNHMVRKRKCAVVPNFVGATLPRNTDATHEYYCLTMLTLFCPWRTGLDLKAPEISWGDSFKDFEFTVRQVEIMKFMNIRYECNDARDDFTAIRKKMGADASSGYYGIDMNSAHENSMDRDIQQTNADPYQQLFEDMILNESRKTIRHQREMAEIEKLLKRTGWISSREGLNPSSTFSSNLGFIDGNNYTPDQWAKVLAGKKDEFQQLRVHTMANVSNTTSHTLCSSQLINIVKPVDQVFLTRKHQNCLPAGDRELLDKAQLKYALNSEQERAFRIVATHAIDTSSLQLCMYIGGMAGTGKSQIIQCLAEFFRLRNQSYRLVVTAPTGSAAALIGGSTYHSAFGIIPGQSHINETTLAKVKSKLQGVDYIFIDEISMVDLASLYKISAQLCRVMGKQDKLFGGLNIIVAGDFAQLAPPGMGSKSLYNGSVGTNISTATNPSGQKNVLGKVLWHHFTTVVLLRQNMRQNRSSREDDKFRIMLGNLRYKSCTNEDLNYLQSRTVTQTNQNHLLTEDFKDVPIITGRNVQRDKINLLCSEKYISEQGSECHNFYSVDRLVSSKINQFSLMTSSLQKQLWDILPVDSDHLPGKLSLCLGMPVMIKHNEATECSVTNGADCIVVGWQSVLLNSGEALETLFVRLLNPKEVIHLEGLPINVVPIRSLERRITCRLPDDSEVHIIRKQVPVIPNFAITDYVSQGKTRLFNAIDPKYLETYQSIYTALSRGSTSNGTVLLRELNPTHVQGGLKLKHGDLFREMQQLELLDDITTQQYEGRLPPEVKGLLRGDLIESFLKIMGQNYIPSSVDKCLNWAVSSKAAISTPSSYSNWKVVDVSNRRTMESNNQVSSSQAKKRKAEEKEQINHPLKRMCLPVSPPTQGFSWRNNSCAFDSVLIILRNCYTQTRTLWDRFIKGQNHHLTYIDWCFGDANQTAESWNYARDKVRQYLVEVGGTCHLSLTGYSSTQRIAELLCVVEELSTSELKLCPECQTALIVQTNGIEFVIAQPSRSDTFQARWDEWFSSPHNMHCASCQRIQPIQHIKYVHSPPGLISFNIYQVPLSWTTEILLVDSTGAPHPYNLSGIVYYNGDHFTSRIREANGNTWYIDNLKCSQQEHSPSDFSFVDFDSTMKPYLAFFIRQN
jgi:hypothetical protein